MQQKSKFKTSKSIDSQFNRANNENRDEILMKKKKKENDSVKQCTQNNYQIYIKRSKSIY